MRAAGIILTVLCALISLFLLWIGYICTFEESQLLSRFESTPREGWDYWIQKEFWEDFWAYTIWVVIAVGVTLVPAVGVWRSGRPIGEQRRADWIWFGFSVPYVIVAIVGTVSYLARLEPDPFQLVPVIQLLGSLYGTSVFWFRARHRSYALPEPLK